MIQYIKGTLSDISEDAVVIENNGIGFLVYVSGQTFEYLPEIGAEVKMYIYFQVREDAFVLYGFLTRDDLRVFKLLIGVNGVGPKGALAILSALSPDDLRISVATDDAKAIATAQGIGAKTAQRVVLELKDKLKLDDALAPHEEFAKNPAGEAAQGVRGDAMMALTSLGYSSAEAAQALKGIEIAPDSDVEDVLRQALKAMASI